MLVQCVEELISILFVVSYFFYGPFLLPLGHYKWYAKSICASENSWQSCLLTFEHPLLLEVPKEPDVDDERHDGGQGDAEAREDGEALPEGDRVLPLLVICQFGIFSLDSLEGHCARQQGLINYAPEIVLYMYSQLCFMAPLERLEKAFRAIGSICSTDVMYATSASLTLLKGCVNLAPASYTRFTQHFGLIEGGDVTSTWSRYASGKMLIMYRSFYLTDTDLCGGAHSCCNTATFRGGVLRDDDGGLLLLCFAIRHFAHCATVSIQICPAALLHKRRCTRTKLS